MESDLHRFFRNRVLRRISSVVDAIKQLLAARSQKQNSGSQRMCPFCGLITPRSKRVCLECGKSLRGTQVERKDATQE
jgi:predicted amidophosphoribosyltransferase